MDQVPCHIPHHIPPQRRDDDNRRIVRITYWVGWYVDSVTFEFDDNYNYKIGAEGGDVCQSFVLTENENITAITLVQRSGEEKYLARSVCIETTMSRSCVIQGSRVGKKNMKKTFIIDGNLYKFFGAWDYTAGSWKKSSKRGRDYATEQNEREFSQGYSRYAEETESAALGVKETAALGVKESVALGVDINLRSATRDVDIGFVVPDVGFEYEDWKDWKHGEAYDEVPVVLTDSTIGYYLSSDELVIHDKAVLLNQQVVRRLIYGNGITFQDMEEFVIEKFKNRRFSSVGVVPAARSVPITKQKIYADNISEQVRFMGAMPALPAIMDTEQAYSEFAWKAGDAHGKLYKEGKAGKTHVRIQAHHFVCTSFYVPRSMLFFYVFLINKLGVKIRSLPRYAYKI